MVGYVLFFHNSNILVRQVALVVIQAAHDLLSSILIINAEAILTPCCLDISRSIFSDVSSSLCIFPQMAETTIFS